jgi:hypothetical protein
MMFSSISETDRETVIENCYWPLLKLADAGIPIAIEATGLTLEIVHSISPSWINGLRARVSAGLIEFIGSGYSQIIGPLVPASVNRWNQNLGLEVYEKLLSVRPHSVLVNEMAFSAGMIGHYIDSKYKSFIMEWNNPRASHAEWENEWRYQPQNVTDSAENSMPIIWADSIAFQKFQRYAFGEIELDEYINYIKTHIGDRDRHYPLYSNDVEIFNFKPGRYHTETDLESTDEWKRIYDLYDALMTKDWCKIIYPNEVLSNDNDNIDRQTLQLNSVSQPIPVKKQEKYNINRWALTGRNDSGINAMCFKINSELLKSGYTNDRKELCYLWSSDFRTHITESRWSDYLIRLNRIHDKYANNVDEIAVPVGKKSITMIAEEGKFIHIENPQTMIVINKNKGLAIKECVFKDSSIKSLFGTIDHGYFDDISLGADYYSGHAVVEIPGEHKITDLNKVDVNIKDVENKVYLSSIHAMGNYHIHNSIELNSNVLTINKVIELKQDKTSIIHPVHFTLNPEAWDINSLNIQTHNGGERLDKYYLKGKNVSHGDLYSSLISARHGFGNTEGIFIIGDKYKALLFVCDMAKTALIPSIVYKEMQETFFFRLQYSAREMDETLKLKKTQKKVFQTSISISAFSE